MKAVVLERKGEISLRNIDIKETVGPNDVRIKIHTVGICGSDIHYFTHGRIGGYIVNEPMVLGHEASGIVVEIGEQVRQVQIGDRVCMEPGIPRAGSRETLRGMYNLDPEVRFWATPPVHGCLRETVVHPAAFVFKLPDTASMAEGAMIEPLAIGLHAATKAAIKPGDTALVFGAGTIGLMTALAATVSGCSTVLVADIAPARLSFASNIPHVHALDSSDPDFAAHVARLTGGIGADIVFEATGSPAISASMCRYAAPGGKIIAIGMSPDGILPIDIVMAQSKELQIITIFRYANMYPRAINLLSSGILDLKRFISRVYNMQQAVEAFRETAADASSIIKAVIEMGVEK